MRVVIDTERCTGHGRCYTLAPEVFDADDDGYGHVTAVDLPEGRRAQALVGIQNCPEQAITIE